MTTDNRIMAHTTTDNYYYGSVVPFSGKTTYVQVSS
jgi:hypothetical protein